MGQPLDCWIWRLQVICVEGPKQACADSGTEKGTHANMTTSGQSEKKTGAGRKLILAGLLLSLSAPSFASPDDDYLSRELKPEELRRELEISATMGENAENPANPPVRTPGGKKKSIATYTEMDDETLWREIKLADGEVIVGLKSSHLNRGYFNGESLSKDDEFEELKRVLFEKYGFEESRKPDDKQPVDIPAKYRFVTLRLDSPDALSKLRQLDIVDYVEPARVKLLLAGLGCALDPYSGTAGDSRLGGSPASDLIPWSYAHLGIQQMWGLAGNGPQLGNDVNVIVTDTGHYSTQTQFSDHFNANPSASSRSFRSINWTNEAGTHCSHGARIAGLAAAPADGSTKSNIVGVAPGSNLRQSKIGDSVLQAGFVVHDIVGAIDDAASFSSVDGQLKPGSKRVVLMAWGMPFESQAVKNAILRGHQNPNVIFVAAAGTAIGVPVFPATMAQTFAVSIVDAPNTTPPPVPRGGAYRLNSLPNVDLADVAAYGDAVDLIAVNSSRAYTPTTGPGIDAAGFATNAAGSVVSVSDLGSAEVAQQTLEITSIGGSSSGVAMIGGSIAAAWSRLPHLSRDQILGRIQASATCQRIASINASCRDVLGNRLVGNGVPDMYVAAGGARSVFINGVAPSAFGTPFTVSAGMQGITDFFDYRWTEQVGGTQSVLSQGSTLTLTLPANTTRRICVTAVNKFDGMRLSDCKDFAPAPTTVATQTPPVEQWVYSVVKVESAASFLNGRRLDINVNQGQFLPIGCDLVEVLGQELTIGGSSPGQAKGLPVASADHANHGFRVSRTGSTLRDLGTLVHAWHDGFSAVRVRAAYRVLAAAGANCSVPGVVQSTP